MCRGGRKSTQETLLYTLTLYRSDPECMIIYKMLINWFAHKAMPVCVVVGTRPMNWSFLGAIL